MKRWNPAPIPAQIPRIVQEVDVTGDGARGRFASVGRKHRRREDAAPDRETSAWGARRIEAYDGEDWVVQSVTGSAATKAYRCPGCDQEIRPATPHVVAYPAEGLGGVDARRHWHSPCWAARHNRGPRTARSSRGPRY